jgi:Cof subfamily protein (haloacid dehalogenase superfamily)
VVKGPTAGLTTDYSPLERSDLYSIIALDLDGTLLTDELRITERSRAAVRRARARGVRVVLASARPPRSMRRYWAELELETPVVAYNGALVWDVEQGRALFHEPLLPDAARGLIAYLRREHPDLNLSIECGDRWYIDDLTEEVRRAIERYEIDPPSGTGCLERVLAEEAEAISKVLFRGNHQTGVSLLAALPPDLAERLHITTSGEWFCEVMAAGATKAAAIEWTAGYLGLEPRGILAIGDSPNDVPMLRAACLGVAMGNAAPLVAEAADVVTLSNNEDGVAEAIERYVLM